MSEEADPRALADMLQSAVTAAMETVDRMRSIAGGADAELKVIPRQGGEPFVLMAEDRDAPYLNGRMAERRGEQIDAAVAQAETLIAALQAVRDG